MTAATSQTVFGPASRPERLALLGGEVGMRKAELEWFIITKYVDGVWLDVKMEPIPGQALAQRELEEWRKRNPGVYADLKITTPPRGRLPSRRGKPKRAGSKGRGR